MAIDIQRKRAKWWQRATQPNDPKPGLTRDKRSAITVELAIVAPFFLTFLFMLFEVAYDQFIQGVLESTTQYTAYQVQTGNANATSAQTFIDNNMCPNAIAHLLGCNNLYVRVQQFNASACQDFYDATSGNIPVSGGVLQLGDYAGETTGIGGNVGPTNCENTSGGSTGNGFCNAGPNEYILMTAIYIMPTFLYALIPGQSYSYGGHLIRAALATTAFYTENFTPPTANTSPC
jgi:Flp pilus assembly protein TadG